MTHEKLGGRDDLSGLPMPMAVPRGEAEGNLSLPGVDLAKQISRQCPH